MNPRSLSRRLMSLVAVVVMAAGLFFLPASTAVASGPHWTTCGRIRHDIAVTERQTRCRTAMAVARAYYQGTTDPQGFTCRRITSDAGAGYYVKCRKGKHVVEAIPE